MRASEPSEFVLLIPDRLAAPFMLGEVTPPSGLSTFGPGCGGPGEPNPDSVVYQNAEVADARRGESDEPRIRSEAWFARSVKGGLS